MLEWKPNQLEQAVLEGRRCGYCRRATTIGYVGNYRKRICVPCDAYVGVKKGDVALGRVAKAPLRLARQAAHQAFDVLWQESYMSRNEAYAWLVNQLGIPREWCHIGMLGEVSCARVVILCEEYLETARYLSSQATSRK
jgi:zinc-finger-containing domain